MKKLLLFTAGVLFAVSITLAQTFKIGPSIGVVAEDAEDAHDIAIGADFYFFLLI